MRVSLLSEHPHFIPLLADAFAREWPEWCARVGRAVVEGIFVAGGQGGMPVILVAFDRIERLLVHRGWEVFARVERDGEEFAWLRREIRPSLSGSGAVLQARR